jgi:hypothetical protein
MSAGVSVCREVYIGRWVRRLTWAEYSTLTRMSFASSWGTGISCTEAPLPSLFWTTARIIFGIESELMMLYRYC